MIQIRHLNATPYHDMKEAALKTIGKRPRPDDKFDAEWVKKSIISRHSHIRCVKLRLYFKTTKPVRDQILRSSHDHPEPYVCSQRPDRTGRKRDASELSEWIHDFSIEALVKMMGDRLCTCTEKETYNLAWDLKHLMMTHDDPFMRVIGECLMPNCGWYGGCKEFKPMNCFKLNGISDISDRMLLTNSFMRGKI